MSENQVKREPLYDQAYNKIKTSITTRKYSPGERLTDSRIAKEISISRTPVREAIKQLVQEGLLVNLPNRGVSVFNPTNKDIAEIYILRASLEGIAAGLAASNERRKSYLYYMIEKLEESKSAVKDNNLPLIIENNIKFHDYLIQASESERLIDILETLRTKSYLIRSHSLLQESHYLTSIKEHDQIFEMIKNGESLQAENYVRNHILAAGFRNLSLLELSESNNEHLLHFYKDRESEFK